MSGSCDASKLECANRTSSALSFELGGRHSACLKSSECAGTETRPQMLAGATFGCFLSAAHRPSRGRSTKRQAIRGSRCRSVRALDAFARVDCRIMSVGWRQSGVFDPRRSPRCREGLFEPGPAASRSGAASHAINSGATGAPRDNASRFILASIAITP
jgi:hypothetical protein